MTFWCKTNAQQQNASLVGTKAAFAIDSRLNIKHQVLKQAVASTPSEWKFP